MFPTPLFEMNDALQSFKLSFSDAFAKAEENCASLSEKIFMLLDVCPLSEQIPPSFHKFPFFLNINME